MVPTQTPRCLRRADSGMPHEELTPRSDSLSTESSTSPPEHPGGSNHSETSSGVHSNASSDHNHPTQASRAPSIDSNHYQGHQPNQYPGHQPTADTNQYPGHKPQLSIDTNHYPGHKPQLSTDTNHYLGHKPNMEANNLLRQQSHETNHFSPQLSNDSNSSHLSTQKNANHFSGPQTNDSGHFSNDSSHFSGHQSIDGNLGQSVARRATSVADLAQPREDQWKSCSLQRNMQPPTSTTASYTSTFYNYPHHTKNHSIGGYVSSSNHNNLTNGQPIYGYSSKNGPNSFSNNPANIPQATYGQNGQNGQPTYGQNGQNGQNGGSLYGYVGANPQPLYDYTHKNSSNQNVYGTNANTPTYGYSGTSSPQTVPHSTISSGTPTSNVVPQPVYGTNANTPSYGYSGTSSPHSTVISGTPTSNVVPQPVYGYSGTSSPQTVSNQPLYGYTQSNQVNANSTTNASYTENTQPAYGFTSGNGSTFSVKEPGGIPVILENTESTVVIRRKNAKSIVCENSQTPVIKEEPFGRSTNMRMTSFTENNDLKNIQASSATLPHYPTQPVNVQNPQTQYSTMPLPLQPKTNGTQPVNLGAGTSCNVYPRQHTTIPTHHNGVRLFPANQNPYVKRYQQNGIRVNGEGVYGTTKPQNESFYSS